MPWTVGHNETGNKFTNIQFFLLYNSLSLINLYLSLLMFTSQIFKNKFVTRCAITSLFLLLLTTEQDSLSSSISSQFFQLVEIYQPRVERPRFYMENPNSLTTMNSYKSTDEWSTTYKPRCQIILHTQILWAVIVPIFKLHSWSWISKSTSNLQWSFAHKQDSWLCTWAMTIWNYEWR